MRSPARPAVPLPLRGEADSGAVARPLLIAEAFQQLRQQAPRVHCLTNSVAQNFTANFLLAAGALPSMTMAPEEIAHFVARSGALLVNLGTLDAERRAALPLALEAAARAGIPVVLDPVFADVSAPRLALAREIMQRKPSVIRMNALEFQAVTGAFPNARRVREFAGEIGATIALTGPTDIVSDGKTLVGIRNGHPYMAQVTAIGCAAGALIAALLACRASPLAGAVAGLAALGVAGEMAAETARGPGSFAVALLDALSALDGTMLSARARIETGTEQ